MPNPARVCPARWDRFIVFSAQEGYNKEHCTRPLLQFCVSDNGYNALGESGNRFTVCVIITTEHLRVYSSK